MEALSERTKPGDASCEGCCEVAERHEGKRLLPENRTIKHIHQNAAAEGDSHAGAFGLPQRPENNRKRQKIRHPEALLGRNADDDGKKEGKDYPRERGRMLELACIAVVGKR